MLRDLASSFGQFTPSLFHDFTKGVMPSGYTFTRNSIATRINSAGAMETVAANVPRIDYDPVTLACRGLLTEEKRTNYFQNSFTPGSWATAGSTIKAANATIGPDGSLVPSFTNTSGQFSAVTIPLAAGFTLANSTTYTRSILFKCLAASNPTANKRFVWEVTLGASGLANASFNLATLTTTKSATIAAATLEDWGNGWYRAIMTFTTDATGTPSLGGNYIAGYASSTDTCTLAFFAAQFEVGSIATSPIPTATAAVTREWENTDLSLAANPSWFNQDQFSLVMETYINKFSNGSAGAGQSLLSLLGTDWSWFVQQSSTLIYFRNIRAGNTGFLPYSLNQVQRFAVGFRRGEKVRAFSPGNNSSLTSSSVSLSSSPFTGIRLGSFVNGDQQFNNYIRKLWIYPRSMASQFLQASVN
ncbi:phage head spike fiber domain-containing protein [Arsenicibacter rosenii]|uniref:Uncharacterized protein n=1 Tax=Arsenicibacter rosenii TaxID=1750698 RepID=A0A1S2VM40_9BACT|nr:hypothetical protein [Arsenicibacter rosenii]OIN59823.1 hypothetical protein BLX24_08165 [Arsenicibacter rosenii]